MILGFSALLHRSFGLALLLCPVIVRLVPPAVRQLIQKAYIARVGDHQFNSHQFFELSFLRNPNTILHHPQCLSHPKESRT